MRTGCYSRSSQSGWSGRAVCLNTYQVGTKWFGSYMILDMLASNEDNFFLIITECIVDNRVYFAEVVLVCYPCFSKFARDILSPCH